jgi:hypothetical protein
MDEVLAARSAPLSMLQGGLAKDGETCHALANARTSRAIKLRLRMPVLMQET